MSTTLTFFGDKLCTVRVHVTTGMWWWKKTKTALLERKSDWPDAKDISLDDYKWYWVYTGTNVRYRGDLDLDKGRRRAMRLRERAEEEKYWTEGLPVARVNK